MYMYKRNFFILAIALLFLLLVRTSKAQAESSFPISLHLIPDVTISRNAGYFDYEEVAAGSTIQDQLLISNSGDETISVQLFRADATTAQKGGVAFSTGLGETPTKSGNWLSLSEAGLITLNPYSRHVVDFTLNVPADAPVGEHAAVMVVQRDTPQEEAAQSAIGVRVIPRVAMTVLVTVSGPTTPQLEINSLAVGASSRRQGIVAALDNSGNVGLKPTGKLTIRQTDGVLVYEDEIKIGYFLAWDQLAYDLSWAEPLPAGEYDVSLSLNYEGQQVERSERLSFTSPNESPPVVRTGETQENFPWQWLLIGGAIALALILLLIAVIIIQSRRMNRMRRQYQ